jgi:inosine-uridine nucleoside N-ribohydrolase
VQAKVPLIIDTDMGYDVDDVGAVCIANALVASQEADILAILHNVGYEKGIGGVSVINHYYGHDHI